MLLDRLEEKGLRPVIRSSRRTMFEQISSLPDAGNKLERQLNERSESSNDAPYIEGDLFCFEDHALFLIFDEGITGAKGMRAGIVHTADCIEPARKLEVLCRNIQDALESRTSGGNPIVEGRFPSWVSASMDQAFASTGPETPLVVDYPGERIRALGLLEDPALRRYLQHICEAYSDGRVVELLSRTGSETTTGPLVQTLSENGLVRREVLVSCRKRNRPLFRLPSTEALNQITSSDAVCSECGAVLSDERFDELIIPTPAANALLNDSSWLEGRVRSVLQNLGLFPSMAPATQSDTRVRELTVSVLAETFLILVFDGDITLADTRTIQTKLSASNVAESILISTGRIQEDARMRLRDYARQRFTNRTPVNVTLIEGLDDLAAQIEAPMSAASERAVVRELLQLDRSLGFSAGEMLVARFALRDEETSSMMHSSGPLEIETIGLGFEHF